MPDPYNTPRVRRFVPVPHEALELISVNDWAAVVDLYKRGHTLRWRRFEITVRSLMTRWKVSRRRVWTILEELQALGFLAVVRGSGGLPSTVQVFDPTQKCGPVVGPVVGPKTAQVPASPATVDGESGPRVGPVVGPMVGPYLDEPETEPETEPDEHMAAARHAADKRQAEQDEQWQALCSRWDTFKKRKPGTTERRLSRSKGQGAELWKMRPGQPKKKTRHADFLLVLDYFEAGDTDHARNFRDTYDTQPITLRRNVDQWADLAREWKDGLTSGPSVADEASRAWDTVLRLLPRSPKLPDRISNNDERETATRAALRVVGVQQLRRANHFDQRAMKAQFLDAYTQARR